MLEPLDIFEPLLLTVRCMEALVALMNDGAGEMLENERDEYMGSSWLLVDVYCCCFESEFVAEDVETVDVVRSRLRLLFAEVFDWLFTFDVWEDTVVVVASFYKLKLIYDVIKSYQIRFRDKNFRIYSSFIPPDLENVGKTQNFETFSPTKI